MRVYKNLFGNGSKINASEIVTKNAAGQVVGLDEHMADYGQRKVVLWEGSWSKSAQITLAENVYNFSFVFVYWDQAPIAPVVVPIINSSTGFRGMGGYVAESGNMATNAVMADIDDDGNKLTLLKAASLVHSSGGAHTTVADRTPTMLVGIR